MTDAVSGTLVTQTIHFTAYLRRVFPGFDPN